MREIALYALGAVVVGWLFFGLVYAAAYAGSWAGLWIAGWR